MCHGTEPPVKVLSTRGCRRIESACGQLPSLRCSADHTQRLPCLYTILSFSWLWVGGLPLQAPDAGGEFLCPDSGGYTLPPGQGCSVASPLIYPLTYPVTFNASLPFSPECVVLPSTPRPSPLSQTLLPPARLLQPLPRHTIKLRSSFRSQLKQHIAGEALFEL